LHISALCKNNNLRLLFYAGILLSMILCLLIGSGNAGANQSLYPVKERDLWGYINQKGKIVIKPRYKRVWPFHYARAIVLTTNEKIRVIDTSGEEVLGQLEIITSFKKGIAVFKDKKTGQYGYCDTEGEVVIAPQFRLGEVFSEGLAAVMDRQARWTKWGYIDRSGKWVIKARFAVAMPFSSGLARVQNKSTDKWHYIDRTGRVALSVPYHTVGDFNAGLAPVLTKEGWGYIDKNGQMVIEPQFRFADPFSQGLAPVVFRDGSCGYIDKAGKVALKASFKKCMCLRFREGIARVDVPNGKGAKIAYIDRKGMVIWKEPSVGAAPATGDQGKEKTQNGWRKEEKKLVMLSVEPPALLAFKSLKQNRFEIFDQLLPAVEDTEWAYRTKEQHMSENERLRFRKKVAEFGGTTKVVEFTRNRNKKYFRKSRQEAAQDFDWSSAQFGGVELSKLKYREEQGLPFAEIYFYVLAGGMRYMFHINDCYRSPRGWRSPDGIRYRFEVKGK